jgi:hypothetical protein
MGLWPTEKTTFVQQPLFSEASPSPLSSRAADLPAASRERNDTGKNRYGVKARRADRQTSARKFRGQKSRRCIDNRSAALPNALCLRRGLDRSEERGV